MPISDDLAPIPTPAEAVFSAEPQYMQQQQQQYNRHGQRTASGGQMQYYAAPQQQRPVPQQMVSPVPAGRPMYSQSQRPGTAAAYGQPPQQLHNSPPPGQNYMYAMPPSNNGGLQQQGSGGSAGGGGSGPGGYPGSIRHQPVGPGPGMSRAEQTLYQLFNDVDRNKSGLLTEAELGAALVNGDYSKFNKETVRLMVKMFDRNGDGRINYDEFSNLWRYLRDWRKIFDKFDLDNSGTINFEEFSRALSAFGYTLSTSCVKFMFNSYAHYDRAGELVISFDMFVQSCINLKRNTDSFKKFDTDRDGYITIGFEEFLKEAFSLR